MCFYWVYSSSSLSPNYGENLIILLLKLLLRLLLDNQKYFAGVESQMWLFTSCFLKYTIEGQGSVSVLQSVWVLLWCQHLFDMQVNLNLWMYWFSGICKGYQKNISFSSLWAKIYGKCPRTYVQTYIENVQGSRTGGRIWLKLWDKVISRMFGFPFLPYFVSDQCPLGFIEMETGWHLIKLIFLLPCNTLLNYCYLVTLFLLKL